MSECQKINSIKKSVAAIELQDLTEKQLLERVGNTGRGTKYVLTRLIERTSGKHFIHIRLTSKICEFNKIRTCEILQNE